MQGEYAGTITKEKLIDSLTGKDVWTPQATFGSAFHLVMEKGAPEFLNASSGLYVIQDKQMPDSVVCQYSEIQLADKFHDEYGQYMTWETWHTEPINIDHHIVDLNMRIDGLYGADVHENKTTTHSYDPKFYMRSLQWRIYLMCMDTAAVQYNIFPYKEPAPMKEGQVKRRKGALEVREVLGHFPVKFYHGGDTMVREVNLWTRGLIDFCDRNDLLSYILAKK